MIAPLRDFVASKGGVLHVQAVWPDYRIEIWPPPALEDGQMEAQTKEPVAEPELPDPGAAEPPELPQEPTNTNSEILKLWREQRRQ